MPWPVDALERVAEYFISSMELGQSHDTDEAEANKSVESIDSKESKKSLEDVQEIVLSDLEKELVKCVMHFNQSVIDASEK